MKKKLLLADDSITIQKVVGIIFSTEDYELTMADDGDSAYNMALELIPDLVLADISMPGKDGFELCQAIKNEASLKNTSVLLLPGAFDHFDETMAQNVCADGWLTKPFESQALLDKVAQLIEAEPVLPDSDSEEVAEEVADEIVEDVPVAGVAAVDAVSESSLGLDAVDDSVADEGVEVSSADDIWDAVSFEEDDLQGEDDTSADSDEDAPFVAAGFGEAVVEPEEDEIIETPDLSETISASEETVDDNDFVIEDIGEEQEEELEEDNLEFTTDEPVIPQEETVEDAPFSASEDIDFTSYSEEETPAFEPEPEPEPEAEAESPFAEDTQEETVEAVASADEDDLPLVDEPFAAETEEPVYDLSGGDEEEEDSFEFSDEPDAEVVGSFVAGDEMALQDEEEAIPSLEDAVIEDETPEVDSSLVEEEEEEEEEEVFDLSEDEIVEELSEDDVVEDDVIADAAEECSVEEADSDASVDASAEEFVLSEEDVAETEDDELVLSDEDEDVFVEEVAVEAEELEDVEEELVVESVSEEEPVDAALYGVDETEAVVEAADEADDEADFYFDGAEEETPIAETFAAAGVAAGAAAATVAVASSSEGEEVVSAEQVEQQLKSLSDDELKEIVARVAGPIIEEMAKEMLEQISWEVVPDLAESMIKEEIRKIKQAVSQE